MSENTAVARAIPARDAPVRAADRAVDAAGECAVAARTAFVDAARAVRATGVVVVMRVAVRPVVVIAPVAVVRPAVGRAVIPRETTVVAACRASRAVVLRDAVAVPDAPPDALPRGFWAVADNPGTAPNAVANIRKTLKKLRILVVTLTSLLSALYHFLAM